MRNEIEQAEVQNRLGRFRINSDLFRQHPGAVYDLFRRILPIRMRDLYEKFDQRETEIQAFGMDFAHCEEGSKIPSYEAIIHKFADGTIEVEWKPCPDLST